MIIQFNSGIQVCMCGAWFNVWLHGWRGCMLRHLVIPIDAHEYTMRLGFITVELET